MDCPKSATHELKRDEILDRTAQYFANTSYSVITVMVFGVINLPFTWLRALVAA